MTKSLVATCGFLGGTTSDDQKLGVLAFATSTVTFLDIGRHRIGAGDLLCNESFTFPTPRHERHVSHDKIEQFQRFGISTKFQEIVAACHDTFTLILTLCPSSF